MADGCELTILMPCLDEAETVGACVAEARSFLAAAGIEGEVLVADNGSRDGSPALAATAGARVVEVERRGYGAALQGGIEAARGSWIVMGDADQSYDLAHLERFVEQLRDGADLVIGNRFAGGIAPDAMPFLHRYVGNPVLSWLGRLLFGVPVKDFHCGLRAFRRDAVLGLGLRTDGMEYASEMVVKASLADLDIREVPTTLRPDGRSRQPHLRTWHDGWRHLRFLLLYSPRWLFLVPGIVMFVVGLLATAVLVTGPVSVGDLRFDVGALVYAAALTIIGFEAVLFALFTKVYAVSRGFLPPDERIERLAQRFRLERGLLVGAVVLVGGTIGAIVSLVRWGAEGWGDLDPGQQLRVVVPAALGLVLGSTTVLSSFFLSILGLDRRIDLHDH